MTALDVYFHSDLVGRLERLEQIRLGFAYEPSWVEEGGAPLSLGLPLRSEPFDDAECRPFFVGLLPEGEFLKSIARAFQVSADNPFSVLTEIGGECAGAVSLASPGTRPPFASTTSPTWLDDDSLGALLAELPRRPLLIGLDDEDEGVRLSLAGAQDKLPVLARDAKLGITRGQPPSTHIIKVPIPDVDGMVANEAFCMALAGEVGLIAAEARPIHAGGQDALLVTRYDRTRSESHVHRIHQEDFCQALGCLPEQKYESEGGPGVEACATLLRKSSAAPAVDLYVFLEALIFNLLIGNADAHSKNYSLLLEGDETPRVAPLYDLLSTRVYGRRFGRKMAMKYGGEYRFDRIRGRHLDRLAGIGYVGPSDPPGGRDDVSTHRKLLRSGAPPTTRDTPECQCDRWDRRRHKRLGAAVGHRRGRTHLGLWLRPPHALRAYASTGRGRAIGMPAGPLAAAPLRSPGLRCR